MNSNPIRIRPNAGFTLVELMVSLMVLGLVVGALSTILISSNRMHQRTASRAELQASSRQAFSLMTAELRQAGADPSIPPAGIVGIVSADSTVLRVRADLNGDGAIQTTEPSEDVIYSFDPVAKKLLRNPGAGAVSALDRVTTMRFSYFNAAGQPLTPLPLSAANRALVNTIGVTVTCNHQQTHPFTLSTRVAMRNQ